jgi:N-dimethylarginine dimethylaminohydrolase
MEVIAAPKYGCQSMTAPLRRVLVRPPAAGAGACWRAFGWRGEPDAAAAAAEHEAFCSILAGAGAELVRAGTPLETNPDAIYTYDPAIVSDRGAVLLRPGKEARLDEPDAMAADLLAAGVPIAARLDAPATAEGGDTLWLDERTLLVGHSYRTNADGIAALREALPSVEVIPFDLPHHRGPGEVLHLMSLISPLDQNLAVVYEPLMPVRLLELLAARSVETIHVPDEEFETMGPNILALGPRLALALEGNVETRRRMERAEVEVLVYKGDEISRKGDGGPTCLTRPLYRG